MRPPVLALIGMGKMGRAVKALAQERGWPIVTEVAAGPELVPSRLDGADVAIEFTTPAAAVSNIRVCLEANCPVVVGTTGWYDQLPAMAHTVEAAEGSVLWSANFSLGATVLMILASEAAQLLPAKRYGAAIVETHHTAKLDAPSGTARDIARALIEARGGSVPISSVRVGHSPGTHEVLFDGTFEQLQLTHIVRDRRVFAEGALAAAEWLIGKRGLFTMRDVLGLGMLT